MPKGRKRQPLRFRRKTHVLRAQEITGAAADLLCRVGCRSLRVDDVAAACGVAKGTCYQHFGSRSDLVSSVVRSLDKALALRVMSAQETAHEPRERLRKAMLMAVDVKLKTLEQRDASRTTRNTEQLLGEIWPCCTEVVPCPYGNARTTMSVLERMAQALPRSPAGWHVALVAVILALPQTLVLRSETERLSGPTIRALVAEFFDRLVGSASGAKHP